MKPEYDNRTINETLRSHVVGTNSISPGTEERVKRVSSQMLKHKQGAHTAFSPISLPNNFLPPIGSQISGLSPSGKVGQVQGNMRVMGGSFIHLNSSGS